MAWRNPHVIAGAVASAREKRHDVVVISDSRGAFQAVGYDHGLIQAFIDIGIKLYALGLKSPGEHGNTGTGPVLAGSGVQIGYRAVRGVIADSGREQLRSNSRAHCFALRNMEAADISALTAENLEKWDTRGLTNFAPNEPLWFNGIRNVTIVQMSGNGTTLTVDTIAAHGFTTGQSITMRNVPTFPAWNGTFTCTVTSSTQFTVPSSTVGSLPFVNGTTYGTAKLGSGGAFDGNDALGVTMERGCPIGNDALLRGHVWMSRVGAGNVPWAWFANGVQITPGNFTPTTSLTRMSADFAAGARAMLSQGVEFRVPSSPVTATGLWWPWVRVERPDRATGVSVSVLYALGGQSSYDIALAFNTMPLASLIDYYSRVTELQSGRREVTVFYFGGMNDAGEGSSLAGGPGGAANSKTVIKFNYRTIYDRHRAAAETAGVRLRWIWVGDYPRAAASDAAEITAATYREAMDELAQERPDSVAFANQADLVSFDEMTDTGTNALHGTVYDTGATNGQSSTYPQAHPYLACGKSARFTGGTTNGTGLLTATLAPSGVVSPTHIRIESGTNVVPGVYAVSSGTGPWQLPDACDTGSGSSVTGTAIDCVHLEEATSYENLSSALLASGLSEAFAEARRGNRARVRRG